MKLSRHIRLAAFTGLVVGILHGMIDIIARIFALSFEWFELYQTLLISSVAFTSGFIILSIFVQLVIRLAKLKIRKKSFSVFYFTTAAMILLLFYIFILINRYLFSEIVFWNPVILTANLLIILVVFSIYILFLKKGKEWIYNVMSFFNKKLIKESIFIVVIFTIASLFLDIYLLNYIPSSKESNAYPNIILITLDTTRADRLSDYGTNINKLAENSVVFENAVSAGSSTLPSHASLFTGKSVSNHNATRVTRMLKHKDRQLAEILKEEGYNTAGFVGGPYCKVKYGIGRGFTTYKDRLDFFEFAHTFEKFSLRETITTFFPIYKSLLKEDSERTSEEINKDVFKWLDKNSKEPFFMFINYFDPHSPYNLGDKSKFTDKTMDYKEVEKTRNIKRYDDVSKPVLEYMNALYNAEIAYLDKNVGKLFDKLNELNLMDDTVIIITADHGEEFYEHGRFTHGWTLYEEVIHVPLIIHYPKEFKPKKIDKRVGNIDIFSTVLDILDLPVPKDIDSISLLPLIKNNAYSKKYSLSEVYGRRDIEETKYQISVSDNNWKYIGVEQWDYLEEVTILPALFNLKTDPKEKRNLYDNFIEKRKLLQKYILNITKSNMFDITSTS